MQSLRSFYCIGHGPSSSHTMGPFNAGTLFKKRFPNASLYRATLFGSLAATGRGHLTDDALRQALASSGIEILFRPDITKPFHSNGMFFEAFNEQQELLGSWEVYSVGGSALKEAGENPIAEPSIYPLTTFNEIIKWCEKEHKELWQYVEAYEGETIWEYLAEVWQSMQTTIDRGLKQSGVLPGILQYPRKAPMFFAKARKEEKRTHGIIFAYALATSEENASGNIVVTAPTCGACGVVPAVLRYLKELYTLDQTDCLRALAVAGLLGNIVKFNGSISGAEVGCQGEVGVACSMAAGMASYLFGGNLQQIDYAAEMGLEHHLGMTCDPIAGYVQVPCIERNAVAAIRAVDAAEYTSYTDGTHKVSFDEIIQTMVETGKDMNTNYKETSLGGLAKHYL
ncbi:L-serine ammonia-lyase [Sulfurospirillum diekertiae]|uniref:L-serine dehydratase n=1 Tax=Sulfurospirillum diekertiae TaxID=1854492 RepID=A0A6G9VUQ6_9BACT|nr:L-serine ammonia-lyase [Sulfurospirillum diekertiae]QIR76923.1 L-serine ammonia-lyase [Sulfurospirillum diekertiae]QIR79541.1 L-serine ammonia-lyase [Sulfurospirillum diekertiae]